MAINRKQYAKVIDDNVLPVSTGLFTPGSPYFSTTPYPAYNPSEATKLVKTAQTQLGGPVSFTFGTTNSPAAIRAQEYIQQAWQAVGFQVKNTIVQQNDDINQALAGTYQALAWRQFGAVNPDLNYIFWSTTTVSSGSLSINMARNADPQVETALLAGRAASQFPTARQRLQDGEQAPGRRPALPVDRPGRLGRHRHAERAELQQPHLAERAECFRADRRIDLAHSDLDQLVGGT